MKFMVAYISKPTDNILNKLFQIFVWSHGEGERQSREWSSLSWPEGFVEGVAGFGVFQRHRAPSSSAHQT